MESTHPNLLDLTHDLSTVANMGTSIDQVNGLLGESIDILGKLIPYDLATIMELVGDELKVRVARGNLANQKVSQHQLDLSKFPTIKKLLEDDRAHAFTETDHKDGDGDAFDGVLDLPHGHSCMVVPLRLHDESLGIMTFDRKECEAYKDSVVDLAYIFGKLLAVAMSHGEQSALLTRLHDQLQEQNRLLGDKLVGRNDACRLMEASQSPAMSQAVHMAKQVAHTDTPVLISGETGTGKEVLANAIHGWSKRGDKPMISINCAALPANLIESELFGHVKGAFSGATKTRMGRFQAANGGTLLLDEIGELPIELQPKLLRALQEGCFEPVGSDRTIKVDVRIIAATNMDLLTAVSEHKFREDLYYRLAVFPVHIPPLRTRRQDIPIIAENFLAALSQRTGRGPWILDSETKQQMQMQQWAGNVRELTNSLERATILSSGSKLQLPSLGNAIDKPKPNLPQNNDDDSPLLTLEEIERQHIARALKSTSGKLYGQGGAAEILGINPNTLRSRMKKLGLGGARDFTSGQTFTK